MARTGEEAKASPPWDAIEAKYWESTRVTRQEEDTERSVLFTEKLQESKRAQMQLSQEREAFLDEMRELEARLAELKEKAERKQRGIEELAKQQALLKHAHDQEWALVVEERALEDEERRDMFAKYRADDVQAFRPAEPGMDLDGEPSATPSPPPARLDKLRDVAQENLHDAQQKAMAPPPTQPEIPSEVNGDVHGQLPRQTDTIHPPQAQPEDQPALQPNGQHDGSNGRDEPLPLKQPELNAQPSLQLEVDIPAPSLENEPIQPGGEGVGEAGDALVTPLSRCPSSDATSRLSTPPSEPQMDIDLVSLSRALHPIGQLDAGEKPGEQPAAVSKVTVVDGNGEFVGEVQPQLDGDGDVSMAQHPSRGLPESIAPERSGRPSGGFTAVNTGSVRPSPSVADLGGEEGDVSGMATNDELLPKRKKKPTKKAQPYKRRSGVETPDGLAKPDGLAQPDDEAQPPLKEITKDVLVLRDDGVVFTDPPAMRGVPLAKITKGDAYWDDEWPDLEATVAASLARWEAKHEEHIAANHSTSSKFLANRQINRGKAILKFLEEGELHPFQIMGKDHVKKALGNYDKLFRMTQILDELTKFAINVTPSQWLRHRLCEVLEEQGDKFDLAHTVNDLYHDPKVVAIRFKSGFGNIGRPPGYKPGGDGSASKGGEGSAKKGASKRKRPHATPKTSPKKGATPAGPLGLEAETSAAASPSRGPRKSDAQSPGRFSPGHSAPADQQQQLPEPLDAAQAEKAETTSPRPTPNPKKARLDSDLAAEDLDYDGYTTTDSFSHDRIYEEDWRLCQVKHAREQTDAQVTQYWHWIEDEQTFEHQVLSDESRKAKWGVYKEPHDFHLRFGELSEVTMAANSKKIVVSTRQYPGVQHRGDLLVCFKRDRTKRRFLRFISKKGIKVVKTTE